MRPRISIWGSVRPSVRQSVGRSVRWWRFCKKKIIIFEQIIVVGNITDESHVITSSYNHFITMRTHCCTVGKMTRMLGIKFCLDLEPQLVLISLHRCLQSLTARNCNNKKNNIGTRGRRKARILGFWPSGFKPCLRHFFFLVWFCQIWMMTTTAAKITTITTTTITKKTKATTITEKFKKNITWKRSA